ncbi:MAG: hypothetical protein E6005_07550 [Peptostreptococcus sp.]|uniref:hypothetical protein n=1 Tax=Bacillota TaxID=1239 RepID=UPI002911EE33|nr:MULTISPECIES: hypothetical protein [Bacillota]MDU3434276.1 hypothetical protein [Veillonella sp.]MDU3454524.1 hypothetical protein [Peptostreptococcus sp.]MDU5351024.1 hypothetical protein [Peptostreptococcus sp.]MDU5681718.1 hypothetical protein [Peptostreptococcus sp.]MDU5738713.1 hypothetical protein [Peptostreptococcus sp.]
MLKSLRAINLYPSAIIDRVFKARAGETARGLRLVVKDMNLENLKFKNYIKINNKLYENEQVEVDVKNRYVDVYFPPLEVGTYLSELLIYDGDKLLKTGIFTIEVGESIITDQAESLKKKLKEIDVEKLLFEIDKRLDILKKFDDLTGDIVLDKNYKHTQIQASKTWNINHNLKKIPSVTVIDSGGTEVIGDVKHLSENELTISFSYEFSGSAILN